MVEFCCNHIAGERHRRFALFGHSMGALLGFEVARNLAAKHGMRTAVLFVSGCSAPQIPRRRRISGLPDPQFLAHIGTMGATPQEVLDNREFVQMLLPTLRADFQIAETYDYIPGPPLSCPIWAYGGTLDRAVTADDLSAWADHTNRAFELVMIRGDHFFLHHSEEMLLDKLAEALAECRYERDLSKHLL